MPGLKNHLDEYEFLSFGPSITLALCLLIYLLSHLYLYVEGRGGEGMLIGFGVGVEVGGCPTALYDGRHFLFSVGGLGKRSLYK